MSKMGQELERRLDANKYELYEALRELTNYMASIPFHNEIELEKYHKARQALAKVEGE